jgi:hypothetical protein
MVSVFFFKNLLSYDLRLAMNVLMNVIYFFLLIYEVNSNINILFYFILQWEVLMAIIGH